jgi:hypothetical protein
MLIVTGTKRSGTSLWMQIMIAAGFPYVGKPYMANWEKTIKAANKNGFYESTLRKGIYFATNPDPQSGTYMKPAEVQKHVVKVFIPGLIKTDLAYISRVIATIRPWREYVNSIRRLHSIEDEHLNALPKNNDKLPSATRAQLKRSPIHPALEWWNENFALIHNFAIRGFAFNLVSYSRLLESPEEIIPPVLNWCGGGRTEEAVAIVNKKLQTQKQPVVDDIDLPKHVVETFDTFHNYFYEQKPLSGNFLNHLNQIDAELQPLITKQRAAELKRREAILAGLGLTPSALKNEPGSMEEGDTHYSE